MKKSDGLVNYQNIFKLNWRIAWYGVFVWVVSLMLSGIVMLPWFYVVFPIAIFGVTALFFRKILRPNLSLRKARIVFFAQGLSVGLLWFASIFILDFLQLVGFDFANAAVYLLDPRNFMKYPIVILVPAIYGLLIENKSKHQKQVEESNWFSQEIFRLHS